VVRAVETVYAVGEALGEPRPGAARQLQELTRQECFQLLATSTSAGPENAPSR
jgi:hypothetical protein